MNSERAQRLRAAVDELKTFPAPDATARRRLRRRLVLERAGSSHWVIPRYAAFAAAVALIAATSLLWAVVLGYGSTRRSRDAEPLTPVQFVLIAPDARSVSLVGDFNRWDPAAMPLRQADDGIWSLVVPLARGAFAYSFVVDGQEWRADPDAPAAPDDFGRPSSVVYVSLESAP